MQAYKNIVSNLPENERLKLGLFTNNFIKSLTTKNKTYDDIKADMKLKGLKGRNYIDSLGDEVWDRYIEYLRKEINGLYS